MRTIFASLLIGWLACVAPPSDDGQQQADDMNVDFEEVLRIARSRAADAHERVRVIGETAENEDVRLVARRIVSLWNEKEGTYFSNSPLPLRRECLDKDALSEVRQKIDRSMPIELVLRITESGEVQTVTIMKGSGRRDVDELVADTLRRRRFLPAKIGDEYTAGELRANCWIEVR